jgi:hypothetical protein
MHVYRDCNRPVRQSNHDAHSRWNALLDTFDATTTNGERNLTACTFAPASQCSRFLVALPTDPTLMLLRSHLRSALWMRTSLATLPAILVGLRCGCRRSLRLQAILAAQ